LTGLDPIVWRDLRRLYELEILDEGEIQVEVELASLDTAPGTLVVTDRRVLFVRASSLSKKTQLVSLPLTEVTSVDPTERRSPIKKRGVLAVFSSPPAAAPRMTLFEHVPGGQKRAEEIARSILRQRDFLLKS